MTTGWRIRVRALDWGVVDAVVAVLLAGAAIAAVAGSRHPDAVSLVAAAAFAATVAWRRRAPAAAILVALVSVTAVQRAGGPELAIAPIVALLDYYTLGRRSGERGWAPAEPLLVALAIPVLAASPSNPHLVDVASVWAFFFVAPFGAGHAIGSRSALTRELRSDADRLAHEQHERALQAAAEERTRIARELHDVVAHSVSVMVVQSETAQRLLELDAQRADAAMAALEDTGREALAEMRRILGVLRRIDDAAELAPQPGVGQIPALVERARGERRHVVLHVDGEPGPLPASVDLGMYRVLHDALAGARGADAAHPIEVALRFGELDVTLEVTSGGATSLEWPMPAMRERVALCDGELAVEDDPPAGARLLVRMPRAFDGALS